MTETQPERYVIDSNIFDKIVDEGLTATVLRLAAASRLVLLSTHVQRDELGRIGDSARLAALLEVSVEQVPTFGFVIGESRIGEARLGPSEPFESLRAGEDRATRTRDALITMTAQFEQASLVTEDADARKRAAAAGIHAIDWTQLRARIAELDDSSSTT